MHGRATEATTLGRPNGTLKKLYNGNGQLHPPANTYTKATVIVVIMDMVSFYMVFLLGVFIIIALMATVTTIYFT